MDTRPTPAVTMVAEDDDLDAALTIAGLALDRPVLVVIGGADGMPEHIAREAEDLFARAMLPVVQRCGGVVVDGGTNAGVMGALGRAAARLDETSVLVGVAARGTVTLPGHPHRPGAAEVEPHHTHLIVVPGDDWGAESEWITRVAHTIARSSAALTVLAGGGEISLDDAVRSVNAGRPLLVLAGTGRGADAIARSSPASTDARLSLLARSTLVRVVGAADTDAVRQAVEGELARGASPESTCGEETV